MEKIILLLVFLLGMTLILIRIIKFIRKSYEFQCLKIRYELKTGRRKWYLVSICNKLVFSILPLKNPDSLEFGKLDKEKALLDTSNLFSLLYYDERISNKNFVNDLLSKTEMVIQKYEPTTE